ncbi:MAG: cobalt ECF transporter T component CbiQ [Elusimicrobiota bacterium]|nr:cobalt ECF transporter T component CbiQ [Elusimicrobiota bacterium]
MHLEEFAEGKSLIHSLDPRIKLISFFPFIVIVAIARGLTVPSISLMASLILISFARLHMRALLNRLLAVNLFILFLWLILPFSVAGKSIFTIGHLTATSEGISYALTITLKANAIVLATIALVATIPIFRLVHALRHFKVPEKLVSLFFFCYRYISVLHEDYSALHNAMKMRAFKPTTNVHTYRGYAYLVGMLVLKSYEHSEKVYQAMLCRGFKGKFPLLDHFTHITRKDFVFFVSMIFVAACLVTLEVGKYFWRLP